MAIGSIGNTSGANSSISTIGSMLGENSALDKLKAELQAAEGAAKKAGATAVPAATSSINATQAAKIASDAQTSYGKAGLELTAKEQKKAARFAKKVKKSERLMKKAEIKKAKKAAEAAKREIRQKAAEEMRAAEKFAKESAQATKEAASKQARALYMNKTKAGTNTTIGNFIDNNIIQKPSRELRKMNEYYAKQQAEGAKKAVQNQKTGILKSVTKFFKEGKGKPVLDFISKHKVGTGIAAATVVLGSLYLLSGDKKPKNQQYV